MKKRFRHFWTVFSVCVMTGLVFSGSAMVSAAQREGAQEAGQLFAEPLQSPEPAVQPAQNPEPAEQPAQSPEPVVQPVQSPEPVVQPAQNPEPAVQPAQSPEPMVQPAQNPEPAVQPAQNPEPAVQPAQNPEPTEQPAQSPEPTIQPTQPVTPKPTQAPKKRGWVTFPDGRKKYFDKNGNYITGFKTIQGKRYCFGPRGFLLPNQWVRVGDKRYRTNRQGYLIQGKSVTINNKVYYFMKNGVMKTGWRIVERGKMYYLPGGARASGLTKVGDKYYYFGPQGIMKTGTFTVGENTYYMTSTGVLEVWKSKTDHYDSQNKKMSSVQAEDFETLQRAKAIAAQITDPSMSSAQKLRKCFDWVVSKYYATRRKFTNFEGWPAVYANDHFIYGSGNCQSDAAAFAYLAKAIGYTNVYVCADSTGWGLPHSWAEIDGLIYDPLFAEVKGYSRYYGSRYGSNTHSRPVVHIRLS